MIYRTPLPKLPKVILNKKHLRGSISKTCIILRKPTTRGISLLNIISKLFAKIVLMKLWVLAEKIYPESQCGFRAKRATIDMIFSLRQLQEKCREQEKPLYVAFIDLTKAFDLVSRDGLFKILV